MQRVTGLFGMKWKIAGCVIPLIAVMGCAAQQGYSVVAVTATVIGVEISQNPATQVPQAKLGYNRAEFAFVPSNRNTGPVVAGGHGAGAPETGEVIMELRYGGIFDTGPSSGIYQRLAVGKTAVSQPGAAYMFARDAGGELTPDVAKALEAVETIPEQSLPGDSGKKFDTMMTRYYRADEMTKKKFEAAATSGGYPEFRKFLSGSPSQEAVQKMWDLLIAEGVAL